MADRYILLAGGLNNAGDYLIEHRGVQLLSRLRPDRQLKVLNGWESFSEQTLALINDSRALILLGGPGLQYEMYGQIYPLTEDLDRIKVPVLMMGIGWNSYTGSWVDSRHYKIPGKSMRLLEKIRDSGLMSSVRDYHTLNALQHMGFDNYVMTGCQVLYPEEFVGRPLCVSDEIKRISFSPGVSFVRDRRMEAQMQSLVRGLIDRFGVAQVTAVFHHSFDPEKLGRAYGDAESLFAQAHRRFAAWLDEQGVLKLDISGGMQAMLDHYAQCDLHVGYRVHAHLLRIGTNQPSILIGEDGRGLGQQGFLGGAIFCAGNVEKLEQPIGHLPPSRAIDDLPREILLAINHEICNEFPRNRQSVAVKNEAYRDMQCFVAALP